MNVLLMQRIAQNNLHECIEDMAERAIYLCHMQALDALESISAQASFEIRRMAQLERWRRFNQIKGVKK